MYKRAIVVIFALFFVLVINSEAQTDKNTSGCITPEGKLVDFHRAQDPEKFPGWMCRQDGCFHCQVNVCSIPGTDQIYMFRSRVCYGTLWDDYRWDQPLIREDEIRYFQLDPFYKDQVTPDGLYYESVRLGDQLTSHTPIYPMGYDLNKGINLRHKITGEWWHLDRQQYMYLPGVEGNMFYSFDSPPPVPESSTARILYRQYHQGVPPNGFILGCTRPNQTVIEINTRFDGFVCLHTGELLCEHPNGCLANFPDNNIRYFKVGERAFIGGVYNQWRPNVWEVDRQIGESVSADGLWLVNPEGIEVANLPPVENKCTIAILKHGAASYWVYWDCEKGGFTSVPPQTLVDYWDFQVKYLPRPSLNRVVLANEEIPPAVPMLTNLDIWGLGLGFLGVAFYLAGISFLYMRIIRWVTRRHQVNDQPRQEAHDQVELPDQRRPREREYEPPPGFVVQ